MYMRAAVLIMIQPGRAGGDRDTVRSGVYVPINFNHNTRSSVVYTTKLLTGFIVRSVESPMHYLAH